jgi:regulator of protease activity HflC (stomatin/prohibitin superfamily)
MFETFAPRNPDREREPRFGAPIEGAAFMKRIIPYLAFAAMMVLVIMFFGCTRVGPGFVGIKVSMAGTNRGVDSYPATTGWVFYNRMTESVFEYPTFVQTAKWTRDPNEGHPVNEEITFTKKDSMLISADISLSYTLRAEKVPAFYVKFRSDDLDKFTHGYLRNVARDMFNETAGKYSIEQIMGDNAPFLQEVRQKLQAQVDNIGVVIEQFGLIGAPRPPDAVIGSINAKVQAQQIALQKQNEIMQAEAEAKKAVAVAEGEAKAKIALAEGEARANQLLAGSISPVLIEWQKLRVQQQAIDKWNGVRPEVEAGTGATGLLLNVNPPRP